MKKENVPQDDEKVFENTFKVVYAIDKDGNYTKVPTKGWEPENVALNQAWEVVNERTEEAKRQVEEGKLSPLAYHIEKNMLDVKLVGQYMDISSKKVKKHLDPVVFSTLDEKTLIRYAEVFQISVEELLKTD